MQEDSVRFTAEVGDSSDPVFFRRYLSFSLFWPEFSEVIANNNGKGPEVILNVPVDYSENGVKKGSLVIWAKKV